MTEYARKFDSELEMLREIHCSGLIEKVALSGTSSLDLEPEEPLVVVNAKDCKANWQGFWFLRAEDVPRLVMESDTQSFYTTPEERLILVDQCSPIRIIETLLRYYEYVPKSSCS